jgi:hypothetical protein
VSSPELSRRALKPSSVWLNALGSMAFIGDPWPTNKTGIFFNSCFYCLGGTDERDAVCYP